MNCTPFLAYRFKTVLPSLPSNVSWAHEHNYRIWHPPIMLYLPFSPGPFYPPLLSNAALCNPLTLYLLICTTHLERYHSFFWSQACHQGSQPLYLALSRNVLLVLRDSSHTSCKHGGKLSSCLPALTFNSARNSRSRDERLLGLPTVRRRAWNL